MELLVIGCAVKGLLAFGAAVQGWLFTHYTLEFWILLIVIVIVLKIQGILIIRGHHVKIEIGLIFRHRSQSLRLTEIII
jgi:TRAP-type uncharacterized transport system fused permease subunit